MVTDTYSEMLINPSIIPRYLHQTKVVGIPKPDGGVRPLCIQECFVKVLNKVLTRKITEIVRGEIEDIQNA